MTTRDDPGVRVCIALATLMLVTGGPPAGATRGNPRREFVASRLVLAKPGAETRAVIQLAAEGESSDMVAFHIGSRRALAVALDGSAALEGRRSSVRFSSGDDSAALSLRCGGDAEALRLEAGPSTGAMTWARGSSRASVSAALEGESRVMLWHEGSATRLVMEASKRYVAASTSWSRGTSGLFFLPDGRSGYSIHCQRGTTKHLLGLGIGVRGAPSLEFVLFEQQQRRQLVMITADETRASYVIRGQRGDGCVAGGVIGPTGEGNASFAMTGSPGELFIAAGSDDVRLTAGKTGALFKAAFESATARLNGVLEQQSGSGHRWSWPK